MHIINDIKQLLKIRIRLCLNKLHLSEKSRPEMAYMYFEKKGNVLSYW